MLPFSALLLVTFGSAWEAFLSLDATHIPRNPSRVFGPTDGLIVYLVFVVLAVVGCAKGWLPGTRKRLEPSPSLTTRPAPAAIDPVELQPTMPATPEPSPIEAAGYCPNCSARLEPKPQTCWNCRANFEAGSRWKPTPHPLGEFKEFRKPQPKSVRIPEQAAPSLPSNQDGRLGWLGRQFTPLRSREDALQSVRDCTGGMYFLAGGNAIAALLVAPLLMIDVIIVVVLALYTSRYQSRAAAIALLMWSLGSLGVTIGNNLGHQFGGGHNVFLGFLATLLCARLVKATWILSGRVKQTSAIYTGNVWMDFGLIAAYFGPGGTFEKLGNFVQRVRSHKAGRYALAVIACAGLLALVAPLAMLLANLTSRQLSASIFTPLFWVAAILVWKAIVRIDKA